MAVRSRSTPEGGAPHVAGISNGGTDTSWVGPPEQAANTLEALGGNVRLTIFEGEGHIMDSTRDGVLAFEQLESFR